jgi:hypothetical protein
LRNAGVLDGVSSAVRKVREGRPGGLSDGVQISLGKSMIMTNDI